MKKFQLSHLLNCGLENLQSYGVQLYPFVTNVNVLNEGFNNALYSLRIFVIIVNLHNLSLRIKLKCTKEKNIDKSITKLHVQLLLSKRGFFQ